MGGCPSALTGIPVRPGAQTPAARQPAVPRPVAAATGVVLCALPPPHGRIGPGWRLWRRCSQFTDRVSRSSSTVRTKGDRQKGQN